MSVRSGLDASIPRRRLEFAYDYASRRVEKRVFNWSTAEAALVAPGMMLDIEATGAAGEVEDVPAGTAQSASGPGSIAIGGTWLLDSRYYFVWDGWNLSMELDGDMNPIRSYGWGLDLSRSEQGAGGVGGLLFATHHTGTSAGTYHTTYDGNGNLVSLRSHTGLAVARYEYGPFGETVTSRDALAGSNPFRFSTKYQDAETGLLYYGYRYYSAGMGRWLSRDPIDEEGGLNLFAFVNNSSMSLVDELGLDAHHGYPLYLGGDPKQTCIALDNDPHKAAHHRLSELLDKSAADRALQQKKSETKREFHRRVWKRLEEADQRRFIRISLNAAKVDPQVTDRYVRMLFKDPTKHRAGDNRTKQRTRRPQAVLDPKKFRGLGCAATGIGLLFAASEASGALDDPECVKMREAMRKFLETGDCMALTSAHADVLVCSAKIAEATNVTALSISEQWDKMGEDCNKQKQAASCGVTR
jgi:RHS repeat-associated protein